jgi:hypothetical protein
MNLLAFEHRGHRNHHGKLLGIAAVIIGHG